MGLLCALCSKSVNGGVLELFSHFRLIHNYIHGGCFKDSVMCSQMGCFQSFKYTWSFKRHIIKKHSELVPIIQQGVAPVNRNLGNDSDEELDDVEEMNAEPDYVPTIIDINLESAKLVCNLRASNIPATNVWKMTNLTTGLFSNVMGHLREKTADVAAELGIDPQNEKLQELFDDMKELETPFKDIDSEYKFKNFLKESGKFVEPISKPLGGAEREYVQRTDRQTGEVQQIPVQETFQYIPLKPLLKLILECPGVMRTILEHHNHASQDGIMRDFQDGDYCRQQDCFTQHTVKIILYVDDIEVTNPLGGKAGNHKLGMIYFMIKSLPSKLLSTLDQVFLLGIYLTKDGKHYGLSQILRPIVDDLKSVERDGIEINTDVFSGTLKVVLAQVLGDNLGIHSLFGFCESFSANYSCRTCKIPRESLQTSFIEDPTLLRNRDNYEEDLATNDLSQTGVKHTCILNELQNFHVTKTFARDIMHDLLEGVCSWELKLVIKELATSRGKFTLALLNQRITSYDYGFADQRNKPNCITENDLKNPYRATGQTAAQMWCLMRHFCLMMGDMVEEDNIYWQLIGMLLRCMDIIFSPAVTKEESYYLKHLIQDHHEMFVEIFDTHLRPKHHFMVHYPRALRELGPLRQYWSMRFEAKHNPFKQIAHVICNFKNIPKSLAQRHQMKVCELMLSHTGPFSSALEVGPGTSELLLTLEDADAIATELGGYSLYDDIFVAKWIRYYGTTYRKGMIVVIAKSDELEPLFGRIIHVLVIEGTSVKLIVQPWSTDYFSQHFHAYGVQPILNKIIAIGIDDLVDFHPLHVTKAYLPGEDWFISPRYNIA